METVKTCFYAKKKLEKLKKRNNAILQIELYGVFNVLISVRFRIITNDSKPRNSKNWVSRILSFHETFTKNSGHNAESDLKTDKTGFSH